MARVCITRPLPEPAPRMLGESGHHIVGNRHDRPMPRDEFLAAAAGCDGLLTQLQDVVDAELMDAAGPQLRVISNYAVGYNNIDIAQASRRGIIVCNTPGVLTEATADIAWLLLLGVARRASEGDRLMRQGGRWDWSPTFMLGADVVGQTLLVIGAGRIGQAVARRAAGWRMKILYTGRAPKAEMESQYGAEHVQLDDGLARADFVSLHVPLTGETRHLIDARRLALMKRTAYLINTARGPVVDEAALVRALAEGTIAGAGLDVYEDEPRMAAGLGQAPHTLLLPHLGSATYGTRRAMAELAVRNLLSVLEGRRPPHTVNADMIEPGRMATLIQD